MNAGKVLQQMPENNKECRKAATNARKLRQTRQKNYNERKITTNKNIE